MKRILFITFAVILCFHDIVLSAPVNKDTISVSFFCPRKGEDIFWGQFIDFMNEAVKDLGMELKVYYAEGNHIKMFEQVKMSINKDNPHVLVFQNFKKQGKTIIKIAEKAQVPAFIVNAGFQKSENMGKPREKYKYWIGEMLPDDEAAGYVLANMLIKQGTKGTDGRIHLVALSGNISDTASIERVKGLKRSVKKRRDVVLEQVFTTDWSSGIARQKFYLIKKSRYPETSIVWAAGDAIALGIVEAVKELNLIPGRDVITGGVDWSSEGLRSVQAGEMSVTLGGHFMEGAWTAVLLHDYFKGKDFISESGQMKSKMNPITKSGVHSYLKKLNREKWHQIDFRKFSKVLNPKIKKYNFGLSALLQQVK